MLQIEYAKFGAAFQENLVGSAGTQGIGPNHRDSCVLSILDPD